MDSALNMFVSHYTFLFCWVLNSGSHTYCMPWLLEFLKVKQCINTQDMIIRSSYLTNAYILTVLICVINVQITVILLTYWLACIGFHMSKTHGCMATHLDHYLWILDLIRGIGCQWQRDPILLYINLYSTSGWLVIVHVVNVLSWFLGNNIM